MPTNPNPFMRSSFDALADQTAAPVEPVAVPQPAEMPEPMAATPGLAVAVPAAPAVAVQSPVGKPDALAPPPDLRGVFEGSAKAFNVPVNVLMALAHQESNYNPLSVNTSSGAQGIMNYMPATSKSLGINPFDPNEAIPAAAKQLRERLDNGASMADAVKEHFAGPNRGLWKDKTAAYGDQVLSKAGQIGALLYPANGTAGEEDDDEADGPAKPGEPVNQNRFSAAMSRPDYYANFIALNPRATPDAIQNAMAQYDVDAAARTKNATSRVQDKFAQMSSPEAAFNAKLNAKLQGDNEGLAQVLPANAQPANPVSQTVAPSTAATIGANITGGALSGLTGAMAAGASLIGDDATAKDIDGARAQVEARMKELGGDTILGKAASLVGGVAPALAAPEGAMAQLAVNAGLFALPAARDTYHAQIAKGASQTLAVIHAAEAAGINLAMPMVATRGLGAVANKLGAEGLTGIGGAAAGIGQAAVEGVGFSAANTALDKGTDVLAGQQNDAPWIDPKDMAAQALGFGALRGAHALAGSPAAVQEAIPSPAPAEAVTGPLTAAVHAAAPAEPAPLPRGASVADQLRALRPVDAPAGPLTDALHGAAAAHDANPIDAPEIPQAPPAPPPIESVHIDDLRGRLKTAVAAIKENRTPELIVERNLVQKEINARSKEAADETAQLAEQPASTGPFDTREEAVKMAPRLAEQTATVHEVVNRDGKFVLQPVKEDGNGAVLPEGTADGSGSAGTAAGAKPADGAGYPGPADVPGVDGADAGRPVGQVQPDRVRSEPAKKPVPALSEAETNPYATRRFASADAARSFMDKNKVDANGFEVVPHGSKQFKIKPKDPAVAALDAAAHEAATSPQNDLPEPTDAQKEAGNYKKGHVTVHGLDITVENPRGSERSGTSPDGTAWSHEMSDHYGYIKRTIGADDEHVDTYIGPKPESDKVFVVDQIDQPTGKFDEHKVMMGYPDEKSAIDAYKSNFDDGWKVGPVTEMHIDDFKAWLRDGDTKQPVGEMPEPVAKKVPEVAPKAAPTPKAERLNEARAKHQRQDEAVAKAAENIAKRKAAAEPVAEPVPAEKVSLSLGKLPNSAEPITVRDGVVHIGEYGVQDYDTGADVTVPNDATPQQIRDALTKAGAIGRGNRIFGMPKEADTGTTKAPRAGKAKSESARAQELYDRIGDEMVAQHSDKVGTEAMRAHLDKLVKEDPKKFIQLAEKHMADAEKEGVTLNDITDPKDTRTIEVDGVRRPIRTSDGELVAPTFDGQKEFWRNYAGEVDEKGRPIIDRQHDIGSEQSRAMMADGPLARMEEPKRVVIMAELKRMQRLQASGKMTAEAYRLKVDELIGKIGERNEARENAKAVDKKRGPDWVEERLMRARRQGELDGDTVDFALWALRKSPALATDLAISLKSKTAHGSAGSYGSAERIMTLLKNGTNSGTAVHEMLHHTERMMPAAIQKGIQKAWLRAFSDAWTKADPATRARLDDLMAGGAGDKAAFERTVQAFRKGELQYDKHYQLVNASEFWAVNATRIMAGRFEGATGNWVARAKQWLTEMVQHVKGALGMKSDSPILKGLNDVLNSTGERQSKSMLGQLPVANQVAYHGSPHEFDKFTLEHMGSGEGAQAYGHGMYFAGEKKVAEFYRNALAEGGKGKMYKVDVPEDHQLLHLDDSLRTQPADVKAKLKEIAATLSDVGEIDRVRVARGESPRMQLTRAVNNPEAWQTGTWAYNYLSKQVGGDKAASELLAKYGIPGAKYADAMSRGADDKSFNYVIYHDDAVKMMPDDFTAHDIAGGAPDAPADDPGRIEAARASLARVLKTPVDAIKSAAFNVKMAVMPMAAGDPHAMKIAKDFANDTRKATAQWGAFDKILKDNYSTEQLEAMWKAADAENDLRRSGKTSDTEGLNSLPADQRETVEVLHQYGEALWKKAQDAGMVDGEGVAYWTPRMAAHIVADGTAEGVTAPNGEFSKEARNLSTTAKSMKHRAYETTDESEAALKEKLGDSAAYVKNIRVMPLAMAQLERAIAGRTLVNQVKAHGKVVGDDLISDNGGPNFVTIDHPALKQWRPKADWLPADMDKLSSPKYEIKPDGVYKNGDKLASYKVGADGQVLHLRPVMDETGKPVMQSSPLYVRKDFAGPLKAVFTSEPNKVYQSMMELKGAVTSMIMISPLTHNLVIWGKAMPTMISTMGWRNNLKNAGSLGLHAYFVGNNARNDHALMSELVGAGMVPVSGRGMNPDIPAIANGIAPGRSMAAKAVGAVLDMASPKAGEMGRKAVDKAGEVWHEKLLWDRVADMQAGMAVMMRASLMDKGIDQYTANRIATHFANRYAGMIPKEAMSEGAHMLLNLSLFSKSFTMTNLGAYKDLIHGLPGDVQAQIKIHATAVQRQLGRDEVAASRAGDQALATAQRSARAKAAMVLALDIGAMTTIASMTQALVQGQGWNQISDDFKERLKKLGIKGKNDPLSVIGHPIDSLASLSQTADNPHGKEDRVRIGVDEHGNSYYARLPVGKVGEELKQYSSPGSALHLLHNKMSTFVKPLADIANNQDFSGHSIYQPGENMVKQIAAMASYWVKSQFPVEEMSSAGHLLDGTADKMDKAKLLGMATGLSVSKVTGGDAVAEMRWQSHEHSVAIRDVLPQVQEAMRRGDDDKAEKIMEDAGATPQEIKSAMNKIDNPDRISRQSQRNFEKHASEEQSARLQKLIDRQDQDATR